jgi:EAL domain-containing protein (putative c-di-GMP-specific phosphodiesterase class I)
LSVHYQPLIDIATQRIVSVEALVRWQHPTEGAISPAAFIPIAEDSGLIVPLGEFVLRTVCEQIVRWVKEGLAVVPVAVNVSAVQLQRQNIWQVVRGILAETGMKPTLLELEITESSIIKDAKNHIGQLQGLRHDGVRILIDDFGTGYSSLSYLKQLPIDALKIDRSFINQIATSSVDAAIVSAILGMARSLGLHVIAEGVETAAQFEVLRTHGCDIAQGFLFSRPVPADGCRQLLLDNASRFSLQPPAAMTG